MPKKQTTAAQKARKAARSGAKYTAELREHQQADTDEAAEQVAALLPPHRIALLNLVLTVEPGTDARAVAGHLADAVLTLPVPAAAIIRPYEVPLSEAAHAEQERTARQAEDSPDDPDGEHLLFLVEGFYTAGDLPDEVDEVARRLAGHWRAELGADTGILSLALTAAELFGPNTYEDLYAHRLDWDVRTPDPHGLVPPQASAAGPRPRPAGEGEALTSEQVAAILRISPVFLPVILGSGGRFVRTIDGAIEQRSGAQRVCRWEQDADGLVYQVVYDRDGVEDTRMLTTLTTLAPQN